MLLDNAVLEFYKWDGEVKDMLANVRDNLNEVAESWTREQKDHCLEETQKSFQVLPLSDSVHAQQFVCDRSSLTIAAR